MFRLHLILILSLGLGISSCTYYLGPNRWEHSFQESKDQVPHKVVQSKNTPPSYFPLNDDILSKMAERSLLSFSDKFQDSVIDVRVAFSKLLLEQDINEVNQTIVRFKAWGTTGTSSKVNKYGDYDFSQFVFAHILYYFKNSPDLLYPETAQHIIDHLIIDNGSKPSKKAPNTLGIIRETENHILMKETSRYLKNQWLFEKDKNPEYNNDDNGMKKFLISHLEGIKKTGFFEFNANPYISYTFEALHVLYNHSNDVEIKSLCKDIMDAENWQYALGSFHLNKYGPFRRRLSRESITSLTGDRHGILIRAELAKSNNKVLQYEELPCCHDRTLITASSNYVLPEKTKHFIENKPETYYALIGHGLKSSPEIYFGNSKFLMSAGGLRFGKKSQIVPRPLSLFLNDEATDIEDCFHIKGKGKLNKWNNTGVLPNFMVGEQAVHIPSQYKAFDRFQQWLIFKPYENDDLYICVFSTENLGIIYMSDSNYKDVLTLNNNEKKLKKEFRLSQSELIQYCVNTKKRWVIKSSPYPYAEKPKKFKKWDRFDVTYPTPYPLR